MHSPRTLRELLGYGVLGLPLAALGLPLVVYLPAYYATLPALGTGLVGTMLIVARFFDVVSDPAIGWASDRFPTRFGRRRPWIAAGVPLLMVAAWYLFVPPDSAGWLFPAITTSVPGSLLSGKGSLRWARWWRSRCRL